MTLIGVPPEHELLGRVVADSATDPAGWWAARLGSNIGASDAKQFSKMASVDRYVRALLKAQLSPRGDGNVLARNGHIYEPALMNWAGVTHNTRSIHHPTDPWKTATPDGIEVSPVGAIILGEAKVKHHIVTGPDLGERRQVVWAQHVIGSETTKWVWQHVHPTTHRPVGKPKLMRIDYDPDLLAGILPIAERVHEQLLLAHS